MSLPLMKAPVIKTTAMKSSVMSLRKYLRTCLLLLAILVILPFSYMIFFLYELGLDDATEQYLQQDMQQALLSLKTNNTLPQSTPYKKYFLGNEHLPNIYQSEANKMADIPYVYVRNTQHVHYGVRSMWQGQALYVFHVFTVNENIEGMQLESLVLMLGVFIFVIMLMGAWRMYRRISLAMRSMQSVLADKMTLADVESAKFEFTEVSEIAHHLLHAMDALEQKTQQEKLFIQSLSHELRTPMAIIQLAIEVLNKKQLGSKVQDKLDAIFNANQNMMSLANQLLDLWVDETHGSVDSLDIKQAVLDAMNTLDGQYCCMKRFELECKDDRICLQGSTMAMQLVLMNLLKNAVIHGQGRIDISLNKSQLIIKGTPLNDHHIKPEDSVGMGLLVVRRALKALGWQSTVNQGLYYEVIVHFKPA